VELFPNARIGRMDRDTVRGRGDMERLLTRLYAGEINLLVGTQMIAKGHDVHGVTLVGVVERTPHSACRLPRRRARLSTAHASLCRAAEENFLAVFWCRRIILNTTRFSALQHTITRALWQGTRIPPLDALSAIKRACQCHRSGRTLEEAAALAATLGRWFAPLASTRYVCWPAAARLHGSNASTASLRAQSRAANVLAAPCELCLTMRRARPSRARPYPRCGRNPSDVSLPLLLC